MVEVSSVPATTDGQTVTVSDTERVVLPSDPASVGEARRFVRRVLLDWDLDGSVEVATLLVSELATNAVLHARTAYSVAVSRGAGEVTIEVLDGSAVLPQVRRHSSTAATGRGVGLVERLATSWGTRVSDVDGFSKAVWFTVQAGGTDASAWGGAWLEGF